MMTSEKTDRCRKKGRPSPRTGMVGTFIGLGVYSLAAALLLPAVMAMAILARGAKKRGGQRDVLFLKLSGFVLILFILADAYQDYMIYDHFQSSRSLQLILAALILYIGGLIYSSRLLKAASFLHLAVILLIVSITLLRWSGLLEGEGPFVTYLLLLCIDIAYPALGYFLLAAGLWLTGRRERRAEKTAGPGGRLSGEAAGENGENGADRACREESGW